MIDESAVLRYEPFLDDDSDVTVLSDKMVTARKAAECVVCFGPIEPGQRVRARAERNNELHKMMTFRFCPACCAAMAKADDDAGAAIAEQTGIGIARSRARGGAAR